MVRQVLGKESYYRDRANMDAAPRTDISALDAVEVRRKKLVSHAPKTLYATQSFLEHVVNCLSDLLTDLIFLEKGREVIVVKWFEKSRRRVYSLNVVMLHSMECGAHV